MSSHAKFPPSGADRWLHCGYSIKMAPFYPNLDNVHSIKGTLKHDIAAMHLENGTEPGTNDLRIYTNHVRSAAEGGILYVERKVIIVPELCTGTADAIVLHPDNLGVIDLKSGKSAVHADAPQLKIYGIGVLQEFPMPKDTPVRLTIVQPNGSSGWPIKHHDTTAGVILKFKDKVMAAIDEGLKDNPKAVAGSWCYWCPAKLHCHAYLIHTGKK